MQVNLFGVSNIKVFIFVQYEMNLSCLVETGARNERRLCALNCNKTPGFEVVHGLLDRAMQLLEIPFAKDGSGYSLKPVDGLYKSSNNVYR